jgi:potassium/sodium efflux P-type ATPase
VTSSEISVHARPASEVATDLGSDPSSGLTSADAATRLADSGPNRLPEPKGSPAVLRFLSHFNDVLIYILLVSAGLKAIYGDWIDFTVILVVAVANAVIGFVQEGRAEQALAGIRNMLSTSATVLRDGAWTELGTEDLVVGDVVRLTPGDRVPADLRLISADNLRIEESALTGEAVPADKNVQPVEPDAGVGDRTCMAFSSSIVSAGRGVGIVTATGSGTEIGRIQQLVAGVDSEPTPLARQLNRFGSTIALVVILAAVAMFAIGRLLHGGDAADLINAAIGFAVAAVPEGLPAVVTITLALGVQQMARRRAITRHLQSVETLGSVSVICSDKTGTLTRNEMTALTVRTRSGVFQVTGEGYEPAGAIEPADGTTAGDAANAELDALIAVMGVCNDAEIVQDGESWQLVGEPTEGALRTLALKHGFSAESYRRAAEVPFDSATKFMATLAVGPDDARSVFLKGAPDGVLARSSTQAAGDGSEPLDLEFWNEQIDRLSEQGLRVLAAARRPAPTADELDDEDLRSGLEMLGLVGIMDPPRAEAAAAIGTCHHAGVRVKMITGDHAGTATAIAQQLGIVTEDARTRAGDAPPTLTGAEIEGMSQSHLEHLVPDVDVYARTSPEHKIRIVRALQSSGQVVAMTGDGVNDAPALTRADVGVAMGIKGTEATKEAADIVLADDNFATIERAIEEGRRIYDNIRKSVLFLLPTNGAQSLVILVAVLLGFALPLAPVQILWVNLVTSVTLALALVFEPAEPGLMDRPPRSPKAQLIGARDLALVAFASVLVAAATFAVFSIERAVGAGTAYSQTAAVATLVLGQLMYLFSCRNLHGSAFAKGMFASNPMVWKMSGLLIALQLLFTYLPFMQDWFAVTAISARTWGISLLAALIVFALVELFKLWWTRPTYGTSADSGVAQPRNSA